jgi:hypothetical protein
MDAEKRKTRVRNRIDQTSHQLRPPEVPVLATKGNDSNIGTQAQQARYSIRLEAGADDDFWSLQLLPAFQVE